MNRSTRTLLAVLISAVLSIAGLVASPANAVVDWVSAPTWKNLHAKIEDGVEISPETIGERYQEKYPNGGPESSGDRGGDRGDRGGRRGRRSE